MRSGVSADTLRHVEALHRGTTGPFTIREAAALLSIDGRSTRQLLAYLAERGWLTRVRHGLYLATPLDASDPTAWQEDPWIIASKVFAPCYIGGWSACEHWGLTDQIFREVIVISGRRLRRHAVEMQGTSFRVKSRPASKLFGVRDVWRQRGQVAVSDPSRTVVDILADPGIGGGIRHVVDVLVAYFEDRPDEGLLLAYAARLGNRNVFKRLGYLVETLGIAAPALVAQCLERKSKGLTMLDPTATGKGKIRRRWDLRINVVLSRDGDGQGANRPSSHSGHLELLSSGGNEAIRHAP